MNIRQQKTKGYFSQAHKTLTEIKPYLYTSIIIFCTTAVIGFILPYFFREHLLTILQNLVNIFEGKTMTETIIMILINNAKASMLAILLGIAFGIFPIILLITNGYLLGFVSRLAVNEEGITVLWRLLPHGIFELPAIIISTSIGLRLGIILIKDHQKLKENIKEAALFYLAIILPLLLLAAIIEGSLIFLID